MALARKLRGVMVMALLWALVWVVVWLPVASTLWSVEIRGPQDAEFFGPPFWQLMVPPLVWGALSGASFAGLIAILGSRRGWNALGVRHALAWGALSGLVAPVGLTALVYAVESRLNWTDTRALFITAAVSIVANGALAAGTIAVAKRGAPES